MEGKMMEIIKEDIPYNLESMVEIIGVDNFLKITKLYGGTSIYIPVHRKMVMSDRNRRIVEEYNGKNLDRLRVRYGLTKQQLKYVLKKEGAIK